MTVNLKNSKHCFCNTTKRERLVGFLKRRKKGFRAEPWDQLQRWERKEAAENVKDRQQLKTFVPTDTSCCTQSFTNRCCCQIWQEQPSPQLRPRGKSTGTAKNNTQPRPLAQGTRASLPPSAEISHVPPTHTYSDITAAEPRSSSSQVRRPSPHGTLET